MRVRMKDIAQDLNVSVVTVSKVLRNQGDISAETRERVLQRARELNYQPNWVARSLVTRKTYLIGLVVPDLMHSFFAEIARAVARKVRSFGYSVVIANSDEDPELEAQEVEGLMGRRVDGLIVASAQRPGETRLFHRIIEESVPFVLIDRFVEGVKASFVGTDDENIGRIATDHLIERGCRRVAHLRGPNHATGNGRFRGYQAALAKHNLPFDEALVIDSHHSDQTGYDAMQQLLKLSSRPDGVAAYNDPVAAGAMKAILEAGLRVPQDIAVMGVGNVHYSDLLKVALTTIDQNSSSIGDHAAELLLQHIDQRNEAKPQRLLVEPRIVVRDSSARA
jgi:LacI family transcriptional regulator